jgi:hypothetical protein
MKYIKNLIIAGLICSQSVSILFSQGILSRHAKRKNAAITCEYEEAQRYDVMQPHSIVTKHFTGHQTDIKCYPKSQRGTYLEETMKRQAKEFCELPENKPHNYELISVEITCGEGYINGEYDAEDIEGPLHMRKFFVR